MIALRVTVTAVAGGTASELAGGSFANGAESAAFQQLFNEAEHAFLKMSLDTRGREFIKGKEGLRLVPYLDKGHWAVGYGHDILPGEHIPAVLVNGQYQITRATANALFNADIATAVAAVNRVITVQITQAKFDALVDFNYNEGARRFSESTLLKTINAGQPVSEHLFTEYDLAGRPPTYSQVLFNRRVDEYNLFSGGN